VSELKLMDYKEFEALYEAARTRSLVEHLERRRDGMIHALWSNPNYDGDGKGENPRAEAIADIEERCEEAINVIITGEPLEEEHELEDEYGFFAAGRRGQEKLMEKYGHKTGVTVGEVIDYSEHIDQ
jgi:hypothetical protein